MRSAAGPTPNRVRVPFSLLPAAAALFVACSHSDIFSFEAPIVGPPGFGSDVQLTYNVEQDYWPMWTEDGKGILYAFVPLDTRVTHRCIGLLPAAGGTRIWQLCDERFVRRDSVSSFTGYALDVDGHLLYAEATAPAAFPQSISHTVLWLADTAAPIRRTPLLNLPITVGNTTITWLTDIAWTGPSTFIALGQQWNTMRVCPVIGCPNDLQVLKDSTFAAGGVVVTGTITAGYATLQAVVGTDSATGYALVDGGTSIVFIRRDNLRLLEVPLTGGAVSTIARVTPTDSAELIGVSCKGSTCLVATSNVRLSYGGDFEITGRPQSYAHIVGANFFSTAVGGELRTVSLATGAVQVVHVANAVLATPHFSPMSNDVVVQVGGIWGHLQTFERGDRNSDLHLMSGIIP